MSMRAFLMIMGFLLVGALSARAQTDVASAADYFNLGSATFIRDEPEKALAIVNEGLVLHPDDEPLLRLKALLEQQQEQNQQNQQQPQDQNQDQDQNENQNEPQQDPSQPPPEENEQEEQEEDQNQQPPESSEQEEPPEQEQPQPGDMSEEEAEMVLDSLRQLEQAQREQLMQEMIRRQMQNMPPVEKDW